MVECKKCGYEWDDGMKFCKNCGTSLINYCSNPECICNESEMPTEFNPNDCYCFECGSKTTFYEAGLIKPDLE